MRTSSSSSVEVGWKSNVVGYKWKRQGRTVKFADQINNTELYAVTRPGGGVLFII